MAMPEVETGQGLRMIEDFAMGWFEETGQNAQDRRFAAAGWAQQRDDFLGPDHQVDVFEHMQRFAVRGGEFLRDVLDLAKNPGLLCCGGCSGHGRSLTC